MLQPQLHGEPVAGGPPGAAITRREWVGAWSAVAANSFGGPAGQIAVMHEEIVVRRRWVGERRFLHALNYCMLLPGRCDRASIPADGVIADWDVPMLSDDFAGSVQAIRDRAEALAAGLAHRD